MSFRCCVPFISQRLAGIGAEDAERASHAADLVATLCRRLVEGGAPALHFYTLNMARPTQGVLQRLG